jgi:hypothetical protein
MSYLISDLQNEIEPKLHDTSLDKLSGSFYDKVYEAARRVLARIDPEETIRTANITNALYDKVYSYVAPTDLKGNSIIAIRPQVNNSVQNNFSQTYRDEFDMYKTNNTFTTRMNSGIKTIEISKALDAGILLNECDSLTTNGTWVAGGNASNISIDTQNKVSGSGSIKFDLAAAGTSGYVEATGITSIDATTYYNTGALFIWVYIPTTAALATITSFTLRVGSNSSNYYTTSAATSASDQTGFKVGWNLIMWNWTNLTTTGSPDYTALTYVRLTVAYSSTPAIPSMRIDSAMVKLGSIFEIEYYSNYLFQNTSGTWIVKPTADTDILNLSVESYNLVLYELAAIITQELQAESAQIDGAYWEKKRTEEWVNYMRNHKSQKAKKQEAYYRVDRRYRR